MVWLRRGSSSRAGWLKEPESENSRLKRTYADLSLTHHAPGKKA
jgi:hypothetical protein